MFGGKSKLREPCEAAFKPLTAGLDTINHRLGRPKLKGGVNPEKTKGIKKEKKKRSYTKRTKGKKNTEKNKKTP